MVEYIDWKNDWIKKLMKNWYEKLMKKCLVKKDWNDEYIDWKNYWK